MLTNVPTVYVCAGFRDKKIVTRHNKEIYFGSMVTLTL